MEEIKKFESIHIDLKQKKFLVNGKELNPLTRSLELKCENGEWTLSITVETIFSSRSGE